MGLLLNYYESLAQKKDVVGLAQMALLDERVYNILALDEELMTLLGKEMHKSLIVTKVVGRGLCYPQFNDMIHNRHIIPLAGDLQKSEDAVTGNVLAECFGNLGVAERHRLELFNYSETYRHMLMSRHPFAQRGTMRNLAWCFCDDFVTEAVNLLQYKTDILNHVNRAYVRTWDFTTWRFSVRTMALAGQYNEDRRDVYKTERFCMNWTKTLPIFFTYFIPAAMYGTFRNYPRRMRGDGLIPYWLARHRGVWTGVVCGLIGTYYQIFSDFSTQKVRCEFETKFLQERRRRKAAHERKLHFKENTYFDNLNGVTKRIWGMQMTHYTVTGCLILLTMFPLPRITFPQFMGDVSWKYPLVPRLVPVAVGLPTPSRCLIPFVAAPFIATSTFLSSQHGTTFYDHYVMLRYKWWKRNHAATELGG